MEKPPRPPGPPSRVFTPFGRERDVFRERKGKEQNFFYPFLISVVVEEKEKKSWMTNARAQHNLHTGRTGRQNNFWCQCASSAQAEFFPGPTSRLNGLGQAQGYIHPYVCTRSRGGGALFCCCQRWSRETCPMRTPPTTPPPPLPILPTQDSFQKCSFGELARSTLVDGGTGTP